MAIRKTFIRLVSHTIKLTQVKCDNYARFAYVTRSRATYSGNSECPLTDASIVSPLCEK